MFFKNKKDDDVYIQSKRSIKDFLMQDTNKKKIILRNYEKYLLVKRGLSEKQQSGDTNDNIKKIQNELIKFYTGKNHENQIKSSIDYPNEEKFYEFIDKTKKEKNDEKEYIFQIKLKNQSKKRFYQELLSNKGNF